MNLINKRKANNQIRKVDLITNKVNQMLTLLILNKMNNKALNLKACPLNPQINLLKTNLNFNKKIR